ncbi:hypothetical protein [Nioella sp.]|uniref:hypothetical protein n=1 Tax=Nioella sp. TaxID=1912091 RepID=UPI003A863B77
METSTENIIITSELHRDQYKSPEWLSYCPKDYYIKYPHKKVPDQRQSLTWIANAITHMDERDRYEIDKRTFLATIHLTPSIHNIHKKILSAQREINRRLINHFKYGSIERQDKIGIINALDYEGSRSGLIDPTSNPTPHLHLILFFPKKLFSHLNVREIPQEICAAVVDSKFVKPFDLNDDGDVISRGIHVVAYEADHPLWYVADYYTKYFKNHKEHEYRPGSLVISPRDEMVAKWQDQLRKRRRFFAEVDAVRDDLINSPHKYFSCSQVIDWTGESSDCPGVVEACDPIIIPRNRCTSIPSIDRIIDDYISACMNCFVRGLDLPLGTQKVEKLLRWEFMRCGGRWNWLREQGRSKYWLEFWENIFSKD